MYTIVLIHEDKTKTECLLDSTDFELAVSVAKGIYNEVESVMRVVVFDDDRLSLVCVSRQGTVISPKNPEKESKAC